MKEKKDALHVVRTFAGEPPSRADLAPAERLTEELYGAGNAGRGAAVAAAKTRAWVAVWLAGAALLICACILFGQFFANKEGITHYFEVYDLEGGVVDDIDAYAAEHGVSFRKVEGGVSSQFEAVHLCDSGKLVYIQQQTMFMFENDFDGIILVAAFTNDRFQSLADFEYPDSSMEVGGVTVEYRIVRDGVSDIYARFKAEGCYYYMHITTAGGAERLERYVGLLLR